MQDDELSEDQSFSMLCTQEVDEDIDVIWDWNSPRANRASHLHLKKQKRLYPSQSPKLTIKRHASNSNIPKFDKLKEEFEAFRNELNSSLRLDNNNENKCFNDFDDDSVEEQLILCSQRIENEFENKTKFCNNVELHNNPTSDSTRSSFSNLLHGTLQEASNSDNSVKKIADDSFDLAIIELPFDDFEVNSPIKEPEESNKTVENQSLLESNEVSNSNEYVKKHPSFELSQSCSKGMLISIT